MTEEMGEPDPCQYCYEELVGMSGFDAKPRTPSVLRRYSWAAKGYVWYLIKLGPWSFITKMLPRMGFWRRILRVMSASGSTNRSRLRFGPVPAKLKAGDLVRVKSVSEILETLDEHGKMTGLWFAPEMVKFTGKQFRVYKVLRKIILETNGQFRRIRAPTVLLDGVICDGSVHGGCDRSCFCFWREAWLTKVDQSIPTKGKR